MSELVRAVAQLAHLVGDTIVQGSATAHMVSAEQADGEWKPRGTSVHLNCLVLFLFRLKKPSQMSAKNTFL